jgi:hypothetical protein
MTPFAKDFLDVTRPYWGEIIDRVNAELEEEHQRELARHELNLALAERAKRQRTPRGKLTRVLTQG